MSYQLRNYEVLNLKFEKENFKQLMGVLEWMELNFLDIN